MQIMIANGNHKLKAKNMDWLCLNVCAYLSPWGAHMLYSTFNLVSFV